MIRIILRDFDRGLELTFHREYQREKQIYISK